jgi:hypothetical protein
MTGFTWSSKRTISPMAMTWSPAFWKAAHEVRPNGGVILTPAAVTSRSLRGTLTLNTPSFSLNSPLTSVSRSIVAVSRAFSPLRAVVGLQRNPTMANVYAIVRW